MMPAVLGDCCPSCTLEREWLRLRRSPLLAAGGLAVYERLLPDDLTGRLLDEALQGARARGHRHELSPGGEAVDTEAVRGGYPSRRLISVEGGPELAALYASEDLARFIAGEVQLPVRPCGQQATYSVYRGEGAGLGIHRDVAGCDLTLIACLHDNDPLADGGATEAWPEALLTPLDVLRRGEAGPGQVLGLRPGQCLLLHGGLVPHRIRATAAGRLRIVALMCFEIVA